MYSCLLNIFLIKNSTFDIYSLDHVTNMTLDNVKDEYTPGEVITCDAEGNPDPEIRWVDEESGEEVIDSGLLVIDALMEGTQTYSCHATNIVRGTIKGFSETITFNVTTKGLDDSENSDGTNAAVIGGSVGGVVFLLLVIVFLIGVIWYLRKR